MWRLATTSITTRDTRPPADDTRTDDALGTPPASTLERDVVAVMGLGGQLALCGALDGFPLLVAVVVVVERFGAFLWGACPPSRVRDAVDPASLFLLITRRLTDIDDNG